MEAQRLSHLLTAVWLGMIGPAFMISELCCKNTSELRCIGRALACAARRCYRQIGLGPYHRWATVVRGREQVQHKLIGGKISIFPYRLTTELLAFL